MSFAPKHRTVVLCLWVVACACGKGKEGLSCPQPCAPVDACHLAGECDPTTGTCTTPAAPDGTRCDDGQACTTEDRCATGVCGGTPVAGCAKGSRWDGGWPAGASQVDEATYQAALTAPGASAVPLDPSRYAADRAAEATAQAQAEAEVAALLAASPELAALGALEPPPGTPGVSWQADGTLRLSLPDGGEVVTQGKAYAVRALAEGQREVATVAAQAAIYAGLYEALDPADQANFPTPEAAPGGLSDLMALNQRVAAAVPPLASEPTTNEHPPGWVASPVAELGYAPSSDLVGDQSTAACAQGAPAPTGLRAHFDFPLKDFVTSVKRQGTRGSCTAFALTAGLEALLAERSGIFANYSEQALYGRARGLWFPAPDDYGEGVVAALTVSSSQAEHYAFILENRAAYNPSWTRVDDAKHRRYSHSCDGYSGPCSDTNHQEVSLCSSQTGACSLFFPEPAPTTTDPSYDGPGFSQVVSFWNMKDRSTSLTALQVALRRGSPVVLELMTLTGWNSLQDGYLTSTTGDFAGAHAVLAVGVVTNEQLAAYDAAHHTTLPRGAGGGFIIVKNSWGPCWGDQGYLYLPFNQVTAHTFTALELRTLNLARPVVTLLGPATLSGPEPGTLTLTSVVAPGKPIIRQELYDGPFKVAEHLGVGPFTLTLKAYENRVHVYTAKSYSLQSYSNGASLERTGLSNRLKVSVALTAPMQVTLGADRLTVSDGAPLVLTAVPSGPGATLGPLTVAFSEATTPGAFGAPIATATVAPYTAQRTFSAGTTGTWYFQAVVTNAQGQTATSAVVPVTVQVPAASLPPVISSFTASPAVLSPDGGVATLSWTTAGATTLSLDQGVGDVTGKVSQAVTVGATTTFTLTATNADGVVSASTTVTVPPPSQCAFPQADCDGTPAVCEASLTSDATCGRCEVSCAGLGCLAGATAASTFCGGRGLAPAKAVLHSAVAGGWVYTLSLVSGSPPADYSLNAVPTDGGVAVNLLDEGVTPGGLAVDDTYVYWGTSSCEDTPLGGPAPACGTPGTPSRILRRAHAGGPVELVTRTVDRPILLAVANGRVWWHSSFLNSGGNVYVRDLTAPATDVGTKVNAGLEGPAKSLVVTASAAFWTSSGTGGVTLRQVALVGGWPSGAVSDVAVVPTLGDPNAPVVTDGVALYWARWVAPKGVYRLDPGGGAPQLVVGSADNLAALAVGGGFVYHRNQGSPGHFYRTPAAGGATLELVDDLTHLPFTALAGLDATRVYGVVSSTSGAAPVVALPR